MFFHCIYSRIFWSDVWIVLTRTLGTSCTVEGRVYFCLSPNACSDRLQIIMYKAKMNICIVHYIANKVVSSFLFGQHVWVKQIIIAQIVAYNEIYDHKKLTDEVFLGCQKSLFFYIKFGQSALFALSIRTSGCFTAGPLPLLVYSRVLLLPPCLGLQTLVLLLLPSIQSICGLTAFFFLGLHMNSHFVAGLDYFKRGSVLWFSGVKQVAALPRSVVS